ncbi:protein phosphatase [Streptomyces sp. XM4193]|uniref:protein-tyrosine phosphatase family protein n=1 Tax=Streptomyces sp. XM4193 TaxID=2929782 RepID=UPI001FF74621|nr:protein-tyrosine phosphatase family protein [Streptomyces sp. XM4193]MCK1795938.1 protein phosphatase [Streptomyces sp. XM4193]
MNEASWAADAAGVMQLPSGRLVRGRGLRDPLPPGPLPEFGIYLQGRRPPEFDWPGEWVPWRDFRLPTDKQRFAVVLADLLERSAHQRVEIACGGGFGRTGTALACLAVLDGVPGDRAVAYVRREYRPRAVETPWQRRFVTRFG